MSKAEERLQHYLPEGTAEFVLPLLIEHKVKLVLTKERISKLGDYRHPHAQKGHTITLNVTLGKYQFLVTLVHELAHLLVWEKYQNKVAPHGHEWKACFGQLLVELSKIETLPLIFKQALLKSAKNPGASSASDKFLYPVLRTLEPRDDEELNEVLLSDLEPGNAFLFKEIEYLYLEKRRTRIVSKRKDGKLFLINRFASVIKI